MISDLLSYASAICGVAVVIMMVMRSQYLPALARYALIGSAFGLFISSRYAEVDHSVHAAIFACGVAGMMIFVAVRHLQAFPPAR
ncbi:hypothetical protein [Sphingomonas sp. Leaf242]|uniref:hypothetical protein n=1 Tax=Sphingomonas sp. Leaf242 TaxID=1736304 RepID=UPI00071322BA|nr:hypothetical protein [Sphingomonas sp. Leaf242]KQO11096.1 hypothetical protein ASF09_19400 [Sphingomonas sp. Leaf242]